MQLLYIHASGDPGAYTGMNSRFYVLGGVSVSYNDWKFITDDFRAIVSKYFNIFSLPEIHAKKLMRGKAPFDYIDFKQLTDDIAQFLSQAHITLFGIAIDKVKYSKRGYGPINTIVNKALEEIVNRFHIWLQRQQTFGLIVSGASTKGFDTSIRSAYEYFRQRSTTYVTLNRIIDTIFFTPSETSIGIQMADFVSYAIKRNYEYGDNKVFDQIERNFDNSNGNLHGLKVIK